MNGERENGWPLAEVMRASGAARRALPVAAALAVARQIGAALGEIHARGVLHGGLSPSTILVSPAGHASLLAAPAARERSVGHLSPEQARGDAADARSDLYSLGVVLFEMLTGEPLFRGADEQELMASVRAPRIPAPSARNASLPLDIDELLLALLSPAPSGRPASAPALLAAIDDAAAQLALDLDPARVAEALAGLALPALAAPAALPGAAPLASPPAPPASAPAAPAPRAARSPRTAAALAAGLVVGLVAGASLRWLAARPVYALHISSIPEGASVSIDGLERGVTPLSLGDPGPRPLRLSLRKRGFVPGELVFEKHGPLADHVIVTLAPER